MVVVATSPVQNVELGKLIMQAVSPLADRHPAPRALIGDEQFWVRADKDRLLSAVQHAISNAQDAVSGGDGSITVAVSATETQCSVAVADNGRGMDDAFVRERLFKPFDSTKGTSGMGIGAHQLRETVRQLGRRGRCQESPGRGDHDYADAGASAGTKSVTRVPFALRPGSTPFSAGAV